MELSVYQQTIMEWVKTGSGDAVVGGVAGCGKTTTIKLAAQGIPAPLCLAFNKHNAESLKKAVPHGDCRTIHSLVYVSLAQILRPQTNDYKYRDIIDRIIDSNPRYYSNPERQEMARTASDIVNLGRLRLVNFNDCNEVDAMCAHFGISYFGDELEIAKTSIRQGMQAWERAGEVDFTDMLYIPVTQKLRVKKFDFIFVDECQDLSPLQLEMVLMARSAGGRMLFVGDARQAIMGFAGADHRSYYNIIDRLNATELPLSICYRCPTSHLDMAREIIPQIEPRPDAPVGQIEWTNREKALGMVQNQDLIICRLTAPVVTMCLKLIASGKPARVRGRAIGEGLIANIKKIRKIEPEFSQFTDGLMTWYDQMKNKAMKKRNAESEIEKLMDMNEALWAAYEWANATSYDGFISQIDGMFSDKDSIITLSTIHRAKGLEGDRVFVLKPEKMALNHPKMMDWQKEQEQNLKYVALTRAKQALYFVED